MDMGRIQTDEQKDREVDKDAQGFTLGRWQIDCMCQEKKEKEYTEDCIDATLQGLEERKKKRKTKQKQTNKK